MRGNAQLASLGAQGAEAQATANEIQRFSFIISQGLGPTDFNEADCPSEGQMAGLNFQNLPFWRSDTE
jgi:hypothetical protein